MFYKTTMALVHVGACLNLQHAPNLIQIMGDVHMGITHGRCCRGCCLNCFRVQYGLNVGLNKHVANQFNLKSMYNKKPPVTIKP